MNRRFNVLGQTLALSAAMLTALPMPSAFAWGPPGIPRDQRNAALIYWKAWAMATDDPMRADIDWTAIGSNLDPAKMPESFTRAAADVATREAAIDVLLEATTLPRCDFELAYEQGFALVLPHIGKMRGGARLLRIDARRLLMENKPQRAAGHIAAMLRMSRQLRDDGVLISSLVGMAISTIAMDEGTVLIESGKLSAADAAPIREALKSALETDAFGVRACVRGEGEILRRWIADKFTGKTAGADLLKAMDFGVTSTSGDELKAAKEAVSKMDDAALNADVALLLKGYRDIDAAWDAADAENRIGEISERSSKGAYGQLAVIAFPSFSRARANVTTNAQKLKDFSARLERLK